MVSTYNVTVLLQRDYSLGVSSVSYLVEVIVPVHFVCGSTEQWPALSPEGCWDTLLTLLFDLGDKHR